MSKKLSGSWLLRHYNRFNHVLWVKSVIMDFQKLLHVASVVQQSRQVNDKRRYSTQISAPKKETRQKGQLSANVKAFLERKEKEEKQKDAEEDRKKHELMKARQEANHMRKAKAMASRTKDNLKNFSPEQLKVFKEEMEKKRLAMLEKLKNPRAAAAAAAAASTGSSSTSADTATTPTKSASKSSSSREKSSSSSGGSSSKKNLSKQYKTSEIIEDDDDSSDDDEEIPISYTDHVNLVATPYTKWTPPEDYKYEPKPKKKKSSKDVKKNTHHKHRHKQSHKHEKAEKHKDKDLKESNKDQGDKNGAQTENKEKEEKPRKPKIVRRTINPEKPPLSFEQLLALAQKKVGQPPADAAKKDVSPAAAAGPPKAKKPEIKMPNRPMTQDEKERWMRRHTTEYQHYLKHGGIRPGDADSVGNEQKKNNAAMQSRSEKQTSHSMSESESDSESSSSRTIAQNERSKIHGKSGSNSGAFADRRPGHAGTGNKLHTNGSLVEGNSNAPAHLAKQKVFNKTLRMPTTPVSQPSRETMHENVLVCGPSKKSGSAVAVEKKPPVSPEAPHRMSAWDRIYGDIKRNQPAKPDVRKRVLQSDSEEEEDLEGFIVDEEEEEEEDVGGGDYSKYIKEIFGYDKSRYKYERDDDLRGMESNYQQQSMEEKRSAQLGRQEDLEDMRQEEEELRRKALKKKKMKMKR